MTDPDVMTRRDTCLALLIVLAGIATPLLVRVPISLADRAGCAGLSIRPTADHDSGERIVLVTADHCVDTVGRPLPREVAVPRIARIVWEYLDDPVDRIMVHPYPADDPTPVSMTAAELASRSARGSEQPMTRPVDLRHDGAWHLFPLFWLLLALAWFRAARVARSIGVVLVILHDQR